MPNNLVFSNVASQLQTQIFGQNGTDVLAIKTDADGNIIVTGTVTANLSTVTAIVDSGTITALLSTVTAIVDSGTITALLSTVTAIVDSGTITALLSTVTAIVDSGTITALLSTVTAVTLPQFSESTTAVAQIVNETVTALTADTSQQRMYSFYVANTSAALLTAFLQISPTTAESYFVNDGSTIYTVAGASQAVLVAERYLKYTRLMLQAGADTASAIVYFNAQS